MSKFKKAKSRILAVPADYTYTEIKYLLGKMGFQEYNKGKTSGSGVKCYGKSDRRIIMLHKPHPGDIMDKGAVEDYLAFCREIGKVPGKEYKGVFNVRVKPALHRELVQISEREGESLNAVVERALQLFVKNMDKWKQQPPGQYME